MTAAYLCLASTLLDRQYLQEYRSDKVVFTAEQDLTSLAQDFVLSIAHLRRGRFVIARIRATAMSTDFPLSFLSVDSGNCLPHT